MLPEHHEQVANATWTDVINAKQVQKDEVLTDISPKNTETEQLEDLNKKS